MPDYGSLKSLRYQVLALRKGGSLWAWAFFLLLLAAIAVGILVYEYSQSKQRRAIRLAQLPVMKLTEFLEKEISPFTFKTYDDNIVIAYYVAERTPKTFRLDLEGKPTEKVEELLTHLIERAKESPNKALQPDADEPPR